jgi:hypothetical protein
MIQGDDILLSDVRIASSPVGITSRSAEDYDELGIPAHDILQGRYGKDLKILEIGAGLSQFAPAYAAWTRQPVTVCDPIDYASLGDLLKESQRHFSLSSKAKKEVHTLLALVNVYTNPRLIHHIPLTLEQAFYGQELGSGYDCILNINATSMYFSRVTDEDMRGLLTSTPRRGTEEIHEYFYT